MQNLYFKTLGIDEKTVSFTLTQKDEISSKDDRQFVREHSKPFPTVESHYCRKNTSRKYLEKDLSINKCTICTNKNVRKKKERQQSTGYTTKYLEMNTTLVSIIQKKMFVHSVTRMKKYPQGTRGKNT